MRGIVVAAVLALALAGSARAQVRPDSTRAVPQPPRPDSLVADSLARQDSIAAADSVFYNLPRVGGDRAVGWDQGVWEWAYEELLTQGAVTLAELVAEVPGVTTLLGGDYGNPVGFTAFGLGGGRLRIFRDGFEVMPVEGGVPDLARVGLVGIRSVRLERNPGEIVIRMESLEYEDPRPYSLVEAGTGDLNTNIFRGTFAMPRALRGSVAVGLERTDSRGARGDAAGNRTGTWLRYQLHRGDDAGLAVDFHRMGTETQVDAFASPVTRTDLTVRGRARLAPGLVGEAYWGRSTHTVEDVRDIYAEEGGRQSQVGARAAWETGPFSAEGAYRHFGGDGLPSARLDLSVGGEDRGVGGFAADYQRASWPETTTSGKRIRVWTRPFMGLSVFGSWESGTAGARTGPLTTPLPPDTSAEASAVDSAAAALPLFRVTDRKATRVGARWSWRGLGLAGARLEVEADSLLPLGFAPDQGGPVVAGGTRTGWEAWARLPTFLGALSLQGSYQTWDEAWPYLPKRSYQGALVYHKTFLESGNFEWWWTLGVRGHDPMTVRVLAEGSAQGGDGEEAPLELASVPFYQNWYARMEARIVTVRIFIGWENFAIRRNLQDFPGQFLPITRAVYGLRWTMWN
ncbi:MAG TPA: Plug domain-containing protein [Longimicrobiales bacterium]|nr:Plug domain-containing protein [Longimicrobiales bacterium]